MSAAGDRSVDVAVVGAGIVGLAHVLAAAKRGLKVVVFERDEWVVGASIRNFGLVWPVGQPAGRLYERALRSREIWREVAAQAGFWYADTGSLHLAHNRDELDVLEEFLETTSTAREQGCELLSPPAVAEKSAAARRDGLLGALWSPTELNVDPRQAIPAVAATLGREYGVEFCFGTAVTGISAPIVETTAGRWRADRVFVCGGGDFETLYPDAFAKSGLVRCKLQMMRTPPQPGDWHLGPSLCAGLTLLHYRAFEHCESLGPLRERLTGELPFHVENGIHVLLSETSAGELTIGDHHEYGLTHDPFLREEINAAILSYLKTFAHAPTFEVSERWYGVYPYLEGSSEVVFRPAPGVTVVNGLGGAGMTLSFGLAEENL